MISNFRLSAPPVTSPLFLTKLFSLLNIGVVVSSEVVIGSVFAGDGNVVV